MDKEHAAIEYVKIYFNSHPDKVPEDVDKAFELFQRIHKKYKSKMITDFKQKSEKFVDKFFDENITKGY